MELIEEAVSKGIPVVDDKLATQLVHTIATNENGMAYEAERILIAAIKKKTELADVALQAAGSHLDLYLKLTDDRDPRVSGVKRLFGIINGCVEADPTLAPKGIELAKKLIGDMYFTRAMDTIGNCVQANSSQAEAGFEIATKLFVSSVEVIRNAETHENFKEFLASILLMGTCAKANPHVAAGVRSLLDETYRTAVKRYRNCALTSLLNKELEEIKKIQGRPLDNATEKLKALLTPAHKND